MHSVTSNAVAEGNFLSSGVKARTYYIVNVPVQSWTDIVYGNSQIETGAYLSLRYLRRVNGAGSIQIYISQGASPIPVEVCIYKLGNAF